MKQPKGARESEKQPAQRSLLNLESGNRRGLERAMQHLLGRKTARSESAATDAALKTLVSLGFEVVSDNSANTPRLTHPLAPGRIVTLELPPASLENSEGAAFDFAATHFPEMDFYLPYITARGRYQAALKKNGARPPLGPEPEYDEDGFLTDS